MAKHPNTTLACASSTEARHAADAGSNHQQRATLRRLQARSASRPQGPPR